MSLFLLFHHRVFLLKLPHLSLAASISKQFLPLHQFTLNKQSVLLLLMQLFLCLVKDNVNTHSLFLLSIVIHSFDIYGYQCSLKVIVGIITTAFPNQLLLYMANFGHQVDTVNITPYFIKSFHVYVLVPSMFL